MAYRIVSPPMTEQITLAEAWNHLRVTPEGSPLSHPDDALIQGLISAARDYCEQNLKRAIAPQVIEVTLDSFPDNSEVIELPFSPISEVISINYVDTAGVTQALAFAAYEVNTVVEPAQVHSVAGASWPDTSDTTYAVRVRYTAGYTLPGESPDTFPLPASIKAAMLLLIGNWYENREAMVVGTIQSELGFAVAVLLKPYQLRTSMA